MQKEKLTCENCHKDWQRIPSRGRKPKLCPSCISGRVQIKDSPKPVAQKVLDHNSMPFPGPSKWACPSCGASISIGIDIKHPPTHQCQKRLKRIYALELIREA